MSRIKTDAKARAATRTDAQERRTPGVHSVGFITTPDILYSREELMRIMRRRYEQYSYTPDDDRRLREGRQMSTAAILYHAVQFLERMDDNGGSK